MAIKLLEDLPGVGPATAEKLREAGFNSIEAGRAGERSGGW